MKPLALLLSMVGLTAAATLENRGLKLEVQPDASARLLDKASGVTWTLNAPTLVLKDKRSVAVRPAAAPAATGSSIRFSAEPGVRFEIRLLASPPAIEYSFESQVEMQEVVLLDKSLTLAPGDRNYYAAPHRLGILLPVEGDKPYTRRLPAYETGRGYSMAMFGAVKEGSALLVSWEDPYTDIVVDYTTAPRRELSAGFALSRSARAIRLQPLGQGGYVEIATAYRAIARQRGFLKTLPEKARENPDVLRFLGAADIKPFAFVRYLANTRWNKQNTDRVAVNFTFEECAQLAEHYKNDLGMERALLVLNGWINGGYDNRHPDVLPAAPEIGGDEGLVNCSRRVRALGKGWVFGLHDNYQDFYKDAPSWDESYIMRNPDGALHEGGVWAGGLAYLICSKKSVELAARPQNVPRVKQLFAPELYFSDTVFAAPLYECSDPRHPLTRVDDLRYKQELCAYLRKQVGMFGSEEGREWGIPHSDYFEGLMGHRTRYQRPNDNDIVIPLFKLVYNDAIPLYSHQSDRPKPDNPNYILDHILYAAMPVYYFPNHRYWTDPAQEFRPGSDAGARMVFAKGGKFNLVDQFIKNTYEVLSPLNRIAGVLPMNDHRYLTPDRKVETTRFGGDLQVTVNYGAADYRMKNAVLPQYGFLIESPKLVAFHATSYGGKTWTEPTLLVAHTLDGRLRTYRAFGDPAAEKVRPAR
jgi:ActR/RegA family two-component response regulator